MYLLFYFSRFTVTSWRRICICFSPFSDLQSLWKPGSVSFFLFLAICGHFRIHECICILLFCNLQSLLVPGIVSYFLLLVICSHILTPEMYLHFSFSLFAVFLDSKKDSGIRCNARYTLILPGFQHSPCCCHCCHHRCSNGSRKNTIFFVHHVLCCSRFVV